MVKPTEWHVKLRHKACVLSIIPTYVLFFANENRSLVLRRIRIYVYYSLASAKLILPSMVCNIIWSQRHQKCESWFSMRAIGNESLRSSFGTNCICKSNRFQSMLEHLLKMPRAFVKENLCSHSSPSITFFVFANWNCDRFRLVAIWFFRCCSYPPPPLPPRFRRNDLLRKISVVKNVGVS